MRVRCVTLVGLLLVVTSCSPATQAGPDAVTLRVQVSGEPEETAAYRALVTAFEEATDGIDVRLTEVADKDDHLARLTTAFAAGNPPDIFLVNYREYSQFVTRGAVAPVGPNLDEAGVDLGGYYPQPIYAFTYDEILQCMPQNVSSLVVYYNRSLFRAAGLRHPESWSWSDFRKAAMVLTEGDVKGVGIEPSVIRIAPFVWSNGGDIVDDPIAPSRFTLGEPKAREAVEFIVSLVRQDGVVPTEQEVAAQDLETRFVAGKLGMYLSSRRDTPVFREVAGLDWDVAPLPTSKRPAGILHSDGYCIASGSELFDEALRFVTFATGSEGQGITALAGRTVPVLKRVATSPAFLDPSRPPRHARVFLDAVAHIRRTPVIATWPEIEDLAEEILTRAFYENGYSVDTAIRALEEATAPLFEDARH